MKSVSCVPSRAQTRVAGWKGATGPASPCQRAADTAAQHHVPQTDVGGGGQDPCLTPPSVHFLQENVAEARESPRRFLLHKINIIGYLTLGNKIKQKRQKDWTQTVWNDEQFFLSALWLIFFSVSLKKKGVLSLFHAFCFFSSGKPWLVKCPPPWGAHAVPRALHSTAHVMPYCHCPLLHLPRGKNTFGFVQSN